MTNERSRLTIGFTAVALVVLCAALPVTGAPGGEECGKRAIHRVEGDVEPPVRVSGERPSYPEQARKERVEGKVVVLSVIDREGLVETVEVVEEESVEREDLRQAALDTVKEWRFEPATLEGEPVTVYYQLTINFRLTKDGQKPGGAKETA